MNVTVKNTARTEANRIAVEVEISGAVREPDPDGNPLIPDRAELVFAPDGRLAWALLMGVAVWEHKLVDRRDRTSFRVGWGKARPVDDAPMWVRALADQVWAMWLEWEAA